MSLVIGIIIGSFTAMILIVIIVLKVSCSQTFLSSSIKVENFGDNDLTYFFSSGIVVSFLFRSSLKSTKRFVCVFLYPRVLESWTLFSFQIFHLDPLLRNNIAGQNGRGHYWIQAGRASNNSNNVNTIQNIKLWNSFGLKKSNNFWPEKYIWPQTVIWSLQVLAKSRKTSIQIEVLFDNFKIRALFNFAKRGQCWTVEQVKIGVSIINVLKLI